MDDLGAPLSTRLKNAVKGTKIVAISLRAAIRGTIFGLHDALAVMDVIPRIEKDIPKRLSRDMALRTIKLTTCRSRVNLLVLKTEKDRFIRVVDKLDNELDASQKKRLQHEGN